MIGNCVIVVVCCLVVVCITRRRLTKFEVRTQVLPLIHWCVCGEKAMLIWYYGIYTQRLNNNNIP